MKRLSVLLLVSASCLGVGCGQKSTTVTNPDGSKATVTQKGGSTEITVTGENGETVRVAGGGGSVALPEGFPQDVPIYPAAKVTTSGKTPETMSVVLATTDPAKKVLDFYNEKLKANTWNIQATVNTEEGGMVTAAKGKSTCSVHVGRGDGQTTVVLGVSETRE